MMDMNDNNQHQVEVNQTKQNIARLWISKVQRM